MTADTGRWIAVRPDVPDVDADDLILVKNDKERAIVNAGIDRAVADPGPDPWPDRGAAENGP